MAEDKNTVIELDGRTGEGGGQLVRIAVALSAVMSQPIRIINVRGNRVGPRGGGKYLLFDGIERKQEGKKAGRQEEEPACSAI